MPSQLSCMYIVLHVQPRPAAMVSYRKLVRAHVGRDIDAEYSECIDACIDPSIDACIEYIHGMQSQFMSICKNAHAWVT